MTEDNTRTPGLGGKLQHKVAQLFGSGLFWTVFIIFSMTWPIVRAVTKDAPEKVPTLGSVGSFQLIDHHGRSFGSDDLKGKVWVATLACSQCPYSNPEFTERVGAIQHRTRAVGNAFHIVTLTIDPKNDTVEVMAKYASKFKRSARRWSFLSGPTESVRKAVAEIFGVLLPRKKGTPRIKTFDPTKSYYLTLVDQNMKIRGYYDCRDDESIDRLLRDVGLVINLAE